MIGGNVRLRFLGSLSSLLEEVGKLVGISGW
jgi:hypothetical protein